MRVWLVMAVPLGLALALGGGETPRRERRLPDVVAESGALTAAIDAHLARRWAEEGLTPSAEVDDLAFARRLWLDLLGTVPSLEELRALEARPAEGRRAWLVDRALTDPRFDAAFAERLARVAVGGDAKPDDLLYRRRRLVSWLTGQVARHRPWDALVRELLTARGLSTSTPAVNFVVSQDQDPIKLAARSTRAFLGIRIDCAQCHDHPFADWSQAEFEGLAAYFARVEMDLAGLEDAAEGELTFELPGAGGGQDMAAGGDVAAAGGETEGGEPIYAGQPPSPAAEAGGDPAAGGMRSIGALAPRADQRVVAPAVPFGAEWAPADAPTRRAAYAAWITHPENPYFARAIVNRLWSWLLGRGFCEPTDELDVGVIREEELLDLLARDLVTHGFQLERTVRAIVSSRAYALSSALPDGADPHDQLALWATYELKRLRADQLGRALLQATSFWTYDRRRATLLRAAHFFQLADWVKRHGEDPDAEAAGEESLLQRLHLMNGKQLGERLKADDITNPANRLPLLAPTDEAAVEAAFLMTLARRPTPEEARPFVERLEQAGPENQARAEVLADLTWALVNTTEFAWNH